MSVLFELSYAGVPFVSDKGVSADFASTRVAGESSPLGEMLRKHHGNPDLMKEIERLLPCKWMNEYVLPSEYPGRNLGAIAANWKIAPHPSSDDLTIGTYYYPTGASRWSIFRGLMTSQMKKAVDTATGGFINPATFVMQAIPSLTGPQQGLPDGSFRVSTNLYCLPPRPIGEITGSADGLYLITLVDERWFFQGTPATIHPDKDSTWELFALSLADQLNITLSFDPISSAYGKPEPDSQLWSNFEYGAVLLDAVAYNVGRTVVRKLDGSYTLEDPASSAAIVAANRGSARTVVRMAGGEIFGSGEGLPGGSNQNARNAIVPRSIWITFPKYVYGDDPVPHYLNSRTQNQRPSSWYEESYGEVHGINVPIQSGGTLVSGVTGVNTTSTIHSTAKALYGNESSAASGSLPANSSDLITLSMQIARDYYGQQVVGSLDEAYPGTFAWEPEGAHDIVWTYSDLAGEAKTRVIRGEWNAAVREMQHGTPALAGSTFVTRGAGGRSVAQTVRDAFDLSVVANLASSLSDTDGVASFTSIGNFPTQNRWKGSIATESILFEGTSGGTSVRIVHRGIDGTIAVSHPAGTQIQQITPNTTFGANLVSFEKGQFVYPNQHTGGGIQGTTVVPQTQTVRVLSASGVVMNGLTYYSGSLGIYNLTLGALDNKISNREPIWIVERTNSSVSSGSYYAGQLIGYSPSNPAPVYAVNESLSSGASITINNIIVSPGSGLVSIISGATVFPSSPKILFTCGDGAAIEGFGGAVSLGQLLYLVNVGPSPCVLRDRSTVPGVLQQIRTPLGFLDLTYSGFKQDYTMWPGDGCTLEFNTGFSVVTPNSGILGNPTSGLPAASGVWSFDNPTIGVGIASNYSMGQLLPSVKTYATRLLLAGSGLSSIDRGDGVNDMFLDRAITVIKNSGSDVGPERKLRLIEGSNITLTVADDPANGEVDVTIASTGGSSTFSGARVYRTTNQTIPYSTVTTILFDSETYDTDTYHDTGSNTGRMTIPSTGYYEIGARCIWKAANDGSETLELGIRKNGATYLHSDVQIFGFAPTLATQFTLVQCLLNAGDYVEAVVFHQNGLGASKILYKGSELTAFNIGDTPVFWITRLGS